MTHSTNDWDFDEKLEDEFQKWFNDDSWMEICGGFSFRSEWFFGDAEIRDEKTRKDLMYKWIRASFVAGWEAAHHKND